MPGRDQVNTHTHTLSLSLSFSLSLSLSLFPSLSGTVSIVRVDVVHELIHILVVDACVGVGEVAAPGDEDVGGAVEERAIPEEEGEIESEREDFATQIED